ncbi:MAG TPA: serine protease [Kofleriaceae bacterium]|jgi:endonuclease G
MRRATAVVLGFGCLALGDSTVRAEAPVIGGHDVAAGKWREVAAIGDTDPDNFPFCTGTLIAPTVVLTAAHCIGSDLQKVVIGTNSLAHPENGETIMVKSSKAYPNGLDSFDLGVVILMTPSAVPPRPIAAGWASLAIKTGATATVAGYGGLDRDSMDFKDEMQEVDLPITDEDCSHGNGCNAAAMPAGELGAGGMGLDTCEGDSGGPLFVTGDLGTFLGGVTSRGYDDNQYTCSEGGIYVRPDKAIKWIEDTAGVEVMKGPMPTWDALHAPRGGAADTHIDANDPSSSKHTFAITTPPKFGMAAVHNNGDVRVCTGADVTGPDTMTVTIADANDSTRKLLVVMPINIENADAPASCSLDDFGGDGGGCCSSSGHPAGSLALSVGVLALIERSSRRRRRRA